jgi:hypothetical protein
MFTIDPLIRVNTSETCARGDAQHRWRLFRRRDPRGVRLRLETSMSAPRPAAPAASAAAAMQGRWWRNATRPRGFDRVVWLGEGAPLHRRDGRVNIMFVLGETLVAVDRQRLDFAGVTRESLLALASSQGAKPKSAISVDQLIAAQKAEGSLRRSRAARRR